MLWGVISTIPFGNLVFNRTLGQYSCRVGFHLPRPSSRDGNHGARHRRVGHWCSWHADDIDEQRTSSPINWRSTFKQARVVGEIITGELRIAKLYHQVRDVVATKDGERGVGVILKEAVLSLTPQRNQFAGLHMPGHTRRTISETHGHGVHSAQHKLSFAEAHILRVLHEVVFIVSSFSLGFLFSFRSCCRHSGRG